MEVDQEETDSFREDSLIQVPRASKGNMDRKQSVNAVMGKEGKFVAKGSYSGKAIGVFTSGGDAQGRQCPKIEIYL